MATILDRQGSMIIYRNPDSRPIPNLDLLTLLFESSYSDAKESTPLHISAANPSHCITKAQARVLTKKTAHAFRQVFGIGANGPNKDVVSVISSGNYLLPIAFYGTVAAGGVFSAASSASTPKDLARQVGIGESKFIICSSDCQEVAQKAAALAGKELGRKIPVLRLSDGPEWGLTIVEENGSESSLPMNQELDWEKITDRKALEDSLIVLIYSSGTTGLPKAVKLSHLNIVGEAFTALEPSKKRIPELYPNMEYRTLAHLPTAHIAGIQGYLVNPFYMGGPVYWMQRFSFPEFLEYNKRYRISVFFTVPPIYLLIAKSELVKDHFDTLRIAISGAAPLGKELQYAASRKLGKGKTFISQTWGLSETCGSATVMPIGENDDSGSVSKLMPNLIARIVDDEGKDVEPGTRGEVWIKGDMVSKGYYRNDAANKAAYADGWFCTGDIAIFKDGLFYIVDRKKELIKYKGLQVAPAELEDLLLAHPDILDACVIGVPDVDDTNEVPRAYVVADKSKVSGQSIIDYVKKNVASHKQLRGGVVFLDAIPKSPAGKLLRKDLREMAKRERLSKL